MQQQQQDQRPESSANSSISKKSVMERSLCTSGSLYRGPDPKEAANGAAQMLISMESSTSGQLTADSTTTVPVNDDDIVTENKDDDDDVDGRQEEFRIRCDVLENL